MESISGAPAIDWWNIRTFPYKSVAVTMFFSIALSKQKG
jgi:hypothetical protein